MSVPSKVARQLKSISSTWPQDPFRPNMQLQKFFSALAEHPKLTPEAVQSVQALRNGDVQRKVTDSEMFNLPVQLLISLIFNSMFYHRKC